MHLFLAAIFFLVLAVVLLLRAALPSLLRFAGALLDVALSLTVLAVAGPIILAQRLIRGRRGGGNGPGAA